MKTSQIAIAVVTAVSLLALSNAWGEDSPRQSAASKQSSKARDFANRGDREGPSDMASGTSSSEAGLKGGDKTPATDSPALEKSTKDFSETIRKLDKMLDRD